MTFSLFSLSLCVTHWHLWMRRRYL